jgi:hypothetical protein
MMYRHRNIRLSSYCILRLPQARHRLLLRVEVQSNLPVESIRSPARNRLLVTSEGEVGRADRHGNGYIDTNLSALDVLLESLRSCPGLGENSYAVSVLVGIDQINSALHSVDFKGDEDWTEDFLSVAFHVWLNSSDDDWADPVA